MPRLRNSTTGAVVDVSEEYSDRLQGAGWEPAEDDSSRKSTAKKSSTSKSSK